MIQTLIRRISAPLAIFLLASSLVIPIAVASEDTGSVTDFLVGAYVCPYDPGAVSVYAGTVPVDCMPVAGMAMHVVTDTLSEQSCTTNDAGSCYVSVPAETWLTITENTSARPDLVPVMNPLVTNGAAMDAVFVHVIEPVVIPEPVVISEPVVPDPVVSEPVVDEPVITDPVVTDPVVTDPVVTDPVVTDLIVTDPVEGGEPVVTDPVVPDPGDGGEPVPGTPEEIAPIEGDGGDPIVTDPEVPATPEIPGPVVESTPQTIDPDKEGESETDVPSAVASPQATEPAYGFVVNAGKQGLACYATPDPSSNQLHLFQDGDKVAILASPENGFVQVQCADKAGYVDERYLAKEAPLAIPSATPAAKTTTLSPATSTALATVIGVEMVIGTEASGLACRETPNEESPVIRTLYNGNQFFITGPVSAG